MNFTLLLMIIIVVVKNKKNSNNKFFVSGWLFLSASSNCVPLIYSYTIVSSLSFG